MVGVAVKVTEVPAHIVADDATIPAVGVTVALMVIVMVLEEAVVAVKQVPPITLISQVTVLPFASVVEVNVLEALLCTLVPFTLKS